MFPDRRRESTVRALLGRPVPRDRADRLSPETDAVAPNAHEPGAKTGPEVVDVCG